MSKKTYGSVNIPGRGKTPMNKEMSDVMKQQLDAFRKKFRRDPNPNDPVFFDPDAETPQEMKLDGYEEAVVDAMRKSGMKASSIYAFQKTGLLLVEGMEAGWPKDRVAEFRAAVVEYDKLHPRSPSPQNRIVQPPPGDKPAGD